MTKFRTYVAAAVLGTGLSLALAAPALADITPGAFCKKTLQGQLDRAADGDSYICAKKAGDTRLRWRPVSDFTDAELNTWREAEPDGDNSGLNDSNDGTTATLPKTGPGTGILAATSGLVLLAGGGGAAYAARRRRQRFVA